MATLKGRAQHKLFALKKKVYLKPMSVGDAHAVAMTVMRSTSAHLLSAAKGSKAFKASKTKYDPEAFDKIITSVVDHRNGSIYAAFVTAIDAKRVFHGDRFAVSLARLGITDELRSALTTGGFTDLAEIVALKAPWFWADYIVKEIATVRKETSSVVTRIISRFGEAVQTSDIDNLVEVALFPQLSAVEPAKIQLLMGADKLDIIGFNQMYTNVFRHLAQSPRILLLDKNSSFEGIFASFYQHLMADTVALQRLLPKAKFGGTQITPLQLQHIFKDTQFARKLELAFMDGYENNQHGVSLERLYHAMRKYNIHGELARAAKTKVNIRLSSDAALALTSGIVGLFSAFAGEMKGQSFPLMQAIKR